ncbi:hypothetical protein HOC80_02810 [archaeon]|jgi:hypothetical protein|nr:hypothetical protein [archaeon]MBT4417012.1 hypothetical protein [archaeon]
MLTRKVKDYVKDSVTQGIEGAEGRLKDYVENKVTAVGGRVSAINEKLTSRFEGLSGRLNSLENSYGNNKSKVSERFGLQDQKITGVENKLEATERAVDERLSQYDGTLEQQEALVQKGLDSIDAKVEEGVEASVKGYLSSQNLRLVEPGEKDKTFQEVVGAANEAIGGMQYEQIMSFFRNAAAGRLADEVTSYSEGTSLLFGGSHLGFKARFGENLQGLLIANRYESHKNQKSISKCLLRQFGELTKSRITTDQGVVRRPSKKPALYVLMNDDAPAAISGVGVEIITEDKRSTQFNSLLDDQERFASEAVKALYLGTVEWTLREMSEFEEVPVNNPCKSQREMNSNFAQMLKNGVEELFPEDQEIHDLARDVVAQHPYLAEYMGENSVQKMAYKRKEGGRP